MGTAALLRDPDIRALLEPDLALRHPNALVRHEMGLCAGERRVDIAAITTDTMHGYEIKSDVDTLARLAGQAATYGRIFNRMTLVTTTRYVDAATAAVPDWWEVLVASGDTLRQARTGGTHEGLDPFALAQLMWRDEALAALKERGAARGLSRVRRWKLWTQLAEVVPAQELGLMVRTQLMARENEPKEA